MIVYKKDIIKEMANNGYNSTRIRREKILPESTMTYLRNNKPIAITSLNTICLILGCQLSDIIEIVPNKEEKEKYNL